jgi:hypothetical protein
VQAPTLTGKNEKENTVSLRYRNMTHHNLQEHLSCSQQTGKLEPRTLDLILRYLLRAIRLQKRGRFFTSDSNDECSQPSKCASFPWIPVWYCYNLVTVSAFQFTRQETASVNSPDRFLKRIRRREDGNNRCPLPSSPVHGSGCNPSTTVSALRSRRLLAGGEHKLAIRDGVLVSQWAPRQVS